MDCSLVRFRDSEYFVSPDGNVYSNQTGRLVLLKGYIQKNGYKVVKLRGVSGSKSMFRLHRVIAEALIPNPDDKPQVNHIDGNKLNNTAENLEWCSAVENIQHSIRHGLKGGTTKAQAISRGLKRGLQKAVFTIDEASDILEMKDRLDLSVKELAKLKGCGLATMYRLVNGQTSVFKEAV